MNSLTVKLSIRPTNQTQSHVRLMIDDATLGCFAGALAGLGKVLFGKSETTIALIGITVLGALFIIDNINKGQQIKSTKLIAGLSAALLIFGSIFYQISSEPLLTTLACGAVAVVGGISSRTRAPFKPLIAP